MKPRLFEFLQEMKTAMIKSLIRPENAIVTKKAPAKATVEITGPALPIKELSTNFLSTEKIPLAVSIISAPMHTNVNKLALAQRETHFFDIQDGSSLRKIAYTISGNAQASTILLCLPGLLETRATFTGLHDYFLPFEDCRVISVDFPGRGESDSISNSQHYRMSLYLSDLNQLIREVILGDAKNPRKLTVLGTSMGGILAMYIAQLFPKNISGIILNDIALTVNWTALYGLYKSLKNASRFKEPKLLAQDLCLDARAVHEVQTSGHFDLPYRADIWGMNFQETLEHYHGKVGLIYGSESKICTAQRVSEAKAFIPLFSSVEILGAGHPAPFNLEACQFIQSQMNL